MSLLEELRGKKEVVERLRKKNLLKDDDIEILEALGVLDKSEIGRAHV